MGKSVSGTIINDDSTPPHTPPTSGKQVENSKSNNPLMKLINQNSNDSKPTNKNGTFPILNIFNNKEKQQSGNKDGQK